jgi:hypothetical protein
VIGAVAESLALRGEVAVSALMLVADSVPLAVRIESAGSALVVLAYSVTAVGVEVALAPRDPALSHGHHRKHSDTGQDGNGDNQYLFHDASFGIVIKKLYGSVAAVLTLLTSF